MNNNLNWSYVAGFVDGEGSIVKAGESDFRIAIPQAHERVLKEIKDFSGVGNICQVKKRKKHWKESWIYFVAKQVDVLFFLKNIYPHLIVKKSIAKKFIPLVANIVAFNRRKQAYLQKKIKTCKFLRSRGLSYRQIGKRLNIDHGYARRLILYR